MLTNIITPEEGQQFKDILCSAQRIAVTCHISPDGDAIGSITAMVSILTRMGKEATAISPDRWPDFLSWIPGADKVLNYCKQKEEAEAVLKQADLIIMMDHNALNRMGELGDFIGTLETRRIMIDHHLDPDSGCELTISHPELCATAEVLYRVLYQLGWSDALTTDEAVCIYTGMMTDTGAFTYASNRAEVYEVVSHLIAKGIDKDRIYRNIFWVASVDRIRLQGYMLYTKMEIINGMNAALMTLNNQERKLFHTKNGDTEGLVNMPLQIAGMRLSIFLREDTEKKNHIHCSLRSVDDFPCNKMAAEFFNGGGHKNASGGTLYCSLDEAVEVARKAIKAYDELLK